MHNRNNSGFSMVMILVAIGLISVTVFTALGYVAYQKQQMKRVFLQSWNDDFMQRAEEILSSPATCSDIFPNQNISITGVSTIPLQVNNLNKVFSDRLLSVKSAKITDVISIAAAAPSLPNTYAGILRLTMEYKDSGLNADKSVQGLAGDLSFNLKIYGDNGTTSISKLKCSYQGSENAIYVSQICNLYGGLLTDGVHCDFPKMNTQLLAGYNTENNNIPYVNIAGASANAVGRVTMPQMLCYIDTLIALSTPLPITTVSGSSNVRNYTKYCARPGGNSVGRASLDVKSIFENFK